MQGRTWKPHQQCDLGWVSWVTLFDPLRIWKQVSHVDGQPPPQNRALTRSLDTKTQVSFAGWWCFIMPGNSYVLTAQWEGARQLCVWSLPYPSLPSADFDLYAFPVTMSVSLTVFGVFHESNELLRVWFMEYPRILQLVTEVKVVLWTLFPLASHLENSLGKRYRENILGSHIL